MKRLLLVAYYFPPVGTSGSMRPLGFCRYLGDHGWMPQVLTVDPRSIEPPLPIDEGLGSSLPGSIRVDRVPDGNLLSVLIRARERVRRCVGRLPSRASNSRSTLELIGADQRLSVRGRLAFQKELLLERMFSSPDPQCFWRRSAVRRGWEMGHDEQPDAVLATGPPWTALLVGRALAMRLGVPFIADFRDPWTRSLSRSTLSAGSQRRARALERSICLSAARIITNTDELEQTFAADYPELSHRFVTITNGFDTDLPEWRDPAPCPAAVGASAGPCAEIELCHFGTVYGARSPLSLLRALKALHVEDGIGPRHLLVRFIGSWEVADALSNELALELEQHGLIRREQPRPHQQCVWEMRSAPVLLALQPGSPLQIPGKLYEYAAARRPLLLIGGEGATASLVERHRLGHYCSAEAMEIRTLLRSMVREGLRIPVGSSTSTGRFHYRSLTAALAGVLDGAAVAPAPA